MKLTVLVFIYVAIIDVLIEEYHPYGLKNNNRTPDLLIN
jgi:hypothetical protein